MQIQCGMQRRLVLGVSLRNLPLNALALRLQLYDEQGLSVSQGKARLIEKCFQIACLVAELHEAACLQVKLGLLLWAQ